VAFCLATKTEEGAAGEVVHGTRRLVEKESPL
jgi:hypothetical protein